MKKRVIIFLFVATIAITVFSEAQEIPSSARSRAAISRVKPKLQREFSRAGFNWGTAIFIRIYSLANNSLARKFGKNSFLTSSKHAGFWVNANLE